MDGCICTYIYMTCTYTPTETRRYGVKGHSKVFLRGSLSERASELWLCVCLLSLITKELWDCIRVVKVMSIRMECVRASEQFKIRSVTGEPAQRLGEWASGGPEDSTSTTDSYICHKLRIMKKVNLPSLFFKFRRNSCFTSLQWLQTLQKSRCFHLTWLLAAA